MPFAYLPPQRSAPSKNHFLKVTFLVSWDLET